MSAFIELQKSIIDLLKADAVLLPMVTKIADYIPDNQPTPYITVGFANSLAYRTHSRKGEEIFFDIHIWSSYEGNKEAGMILKEVDRLLGDNTSLCVVGFDLIAMYNDGFTVLKEKINEVFYRHIIFGLRILITNKLERT